MQLIEQHVPLGQHETYPLLPQLDYARRWLDGFISILESYLVSLSSPLLTIGIGFSMMDFLTQGALLQNPMIGGVWAFIQTAAVDCQFISMWYKAKVAFKDGNKLALRGYVFLGIILAFVTFGANAVPSLQHATGVNFLDAISRLGLNPISLIYARSGVSIMLAIIAAWTRTIIVFSPVKKAEITLIKQKAFEQTITALEPASEANLQNVLPDKNEPNFQPSFEPENKPVLQEKKEPMAASKSLSFEQVKTMTGLDEKQIKALIKKKVFATTPRNQNLVLTSSIVAWKEQAS